MTVLRTASSRTSVLLLELLCRHRWGVAPRFATVRAEAADLDALAGFPHEAVLVIGDAALVLAAQGQYPHAWTSARRGRRGPACRSSLRSGRRGGMRRPPAVRELHQRLLASRAWGLAHLDLLAADAAAAPPACRSPSAATTWATSTTRCAATAPGRADRLLPSAGPGWAGARRVALLHHGGVTMNDVDRIPPEFRDYLELYEKAALLELGHRADAVRWRCTRSRSSPTSSTATSTTPTSAWPTASSARSTAGPRTAKDTS